MAKSRNKNNKAKVEDVGKVKSFETLQVKIKTIGENSDKKISPIIGYFPSGYDPLKNHHNQEVNHSVKVYKSLNMRNPKKPRMQLVVREDGSQVNFVGTSYSGEATTPHLCNYALGVLDKETGVLNIVPIAANRIFRLEPKIGESEQPENEFHEAEVTAEERADRFRHLTLLYSTKMNIRRDVKFDTLRQTEDPETQQGLDYKLKEIKINKEALQAIASTTNARNIPPYDLGATTSNMAFPLNKIILEGEWDYLLDIFELTQAGMIWRKDRWLAYCLISLISSSSRTEIPWMACHLQNVTSFLASSCRSFPACLVQMKEESQVKNGNCLLVMSWYSPCLLTVFGQTLRI